MRHTYTDITKTRARELAKQATDYGYLHPLHADHSYSYCLECRTKVAGYHAPSATPTVRVKAIHAALVDHLTSGDCSAHPDLGE